MEGEEDAGRVQLAVVFDGQEYSVDTNAVDAGDGTDTALVSLDLLQCQLMSLAGLAPDEQVLLSSDGKVLCRPEADLPPMLPVAKTRRARLFLLESGVASGVPPDWREICTKCSFGDATVVQSAFRKTDGASVLVCGPCARTCSTAFQPVHSLEWGELPAVASRFVSDIALVAGEIDVPAPAGYTKLPSDLNFGSDGDYVYLCVKRGGPRALTQLLVQRSPPLDQTDEDKSPLPATPLSLAEHIVSVDHGNGIIHLGFDCVPLADASDNLDTLAITDVVIVYGDVQLPTRGFIKIPTSLNGGAAGAGAKPVYLCYQVAPVGGFACDSGREHSEFGECLFASRFLSDSAASSVGRGLSERLILSSERKKNDSAMLEAHYRRHQPSMKKRLEDGIQRARSYESKSMQEEALKHIPVKLLEERARANPSPMPLYQDELVKQLLHWFKREFFTWMNQPRCASCNHEKTRAVRTEGPKTAEEIAGQASRVEVYQCPSCSSFTRFPRYNDPVKLLTTRTGRCGEWANCFTLCCRAMGFEARYVLDVTDHVWTEVYSEHFKRWLHCDSCEDQLDCPLTYEVGWGKKLSYIFSFSSEEVVDTARRYTQNWDAMRARRRDVSEDWLKTVIQQMNQSLWQQLPSERVEVLQARAKVEQDELRSGRSVKKGEVQGRVSGSTEWKSGRQEDGKSGDSTLSSTAAGATARRHDNSGANAVPSKAELLQQIFRNLVVGCGNAACVNPYCARASSQSAKIKSADPTERAASAIQIVGALNEKPIAAEALALMLCPSESHDIRAFVLGHGPTAYYPLQDPPRALSGSCIVDVSGYDHHVFDDSDRSSMGALRKPFRIPHGGAEGERAFGMQILAGQQLGVLSGVSSGGFVASFLFRIDEFSLPRRDISDKTRQDCLEILIHPTDSHSSRVLFRVARDRAKGQFAWQLKYKVGDSEQTLSGAAAVEFNRYGNITVAASEHGVAVFIDGANVTNVGAANTDWFQGDATRALIIRSPQLSDTTEPSIGVAICHLAIFPFVSFDGAATLAKEVSQRYVSAPPLRAYGPNGVIADKRCSEKAATARSGYRVSRVQMWGGQFLDGIQFVYASTSPRDTADAVVHGPLVGNAATRNAAKIPTVVFDLWEDEYVAEVSGRKGAWTDGIKLRTNFGREVRCGGNGGGDFAIRLPPDSEVRAIAFNVGDHLTNPVAFVVDGAPSASVPPLKSSVIMERLRAILPSTATGSSQNAITAMLRYLSNIVSLPTELKFQRIRASNKFFIANIAALGDEVTNALMHWSGFVVEATSEGTDDKFYVFQPEQRSDEGDPAALGAQAQKRIACLELLLAEVGGTTK